MKTIKTKPNQTVYDVALEHYGTCEAIGKLIEDNPDIVNDTEILVALGVDSNKDSSFYPDAALEADQSLDIDTASILIDKSALRQIENDITTFEL